MERDFSPLGRFLSSLERCWEVCRHEVPSTLFLKTVPHSSQTDPMCSEPETNSSGAVQPLLLQWLCCLLWVWTNPLNLHIPRTKCCWQQQELCDVLAPTVASLFSKPLSSDLPTGISGYYQHQALIQRCSSFLGKLNMSFCYSFILK